MICAESTPPVSAAIMRKTLARNIEALRGSGCIESAIAAQLAGFAEAIDGIGEVSVDADGTVCVGASPQIADPGFAGDILGGRTQRPVVLVGMRPSAACRSLVKRALPEAPRMTGLVSLVETDPGAAAWTLALVDITPLVEKNRLRLFIGDDAVRRFFAEVDTWRRDVARPVPVGAGFTLADLPGHPTANAIRNGLDVRSRAQENATRALVTQAEAYYAARSAEDWRARFDRAARGVGEPLRVLLPTSAHTTFVRCSAGDIAESWRRAGAETEVLVEPSADHRLTLMSYVERLASFKPDLVVKINYHRHDLLKKAPRIAVPWVCWVQDPMPHLLAPRGVPFGRFDMVAGHMYDELFTQAGVSRDMFLHTPVLVDETKFCPAPAVHASRARFDCEIAFVTNHAEPPAVLGERLAASCTADGGSVREMIAAVLDRLGGMASAIDKGGMDTEEAVLGVAADVLKETSRRGAEPTLIRSVSRSIVEPLLERHLRHDALAWSRDVCDRRGWRLRIYGAGWNDGPYAQHAMGPVEHDDALRDVYQRSLVTIHASTRRPWHQRVMECASSGGLPLVRWLPWFGSSPLETLGRAEMWKMPTHTDGPRYRDPWYTYDGLKIEESWADWWWIGERCDRVMPGLGPETRVWFRVADEPALMELVRRCQARGVAMPWLEDGCVRIDPWALRAMAIGTAARRAAGDPRQGIMPDPHDLMIDPAVTGFASDSELEHRLESFLEDPSVRDAHASAIANRVRDGYTYGALLPRLLGMLGRQTLAAAGARSVAGVSRRVGSVSGGE